MIIVLNNSPIKQTLTKPEKSGRVAKWAIELGEHDIVFQERGDETPKDFLIKVPFEDNKKETKEKTDTKPTKTSCKWKLFTNGVVSSNCSRARLMLIDPEGKEYTYALRFGFETINNEAEYEALLARLRISQEMEITSLAIFVDSQLLVNQIKGTYAAKQPTIREYLQKTKEAMKGFDNYTIEHIRRNQNTKADVLSKLASMTFKHLTKEVLVKVLSKRSTKEKEILQDPKESKKIRVKSPQYKLIRGNLYQKSFNTPWLRYVASPQIDDIIKEPSMHRDAAKTLQDCEKCKEQSAIKKVAESNAMTTGSGWPFSRFGVNILRPLTTTPRGFKFLAIAIEHSTKWVEAKPLTVINERHAERFVWEYVVCIFGVPRTINLKDEKHFREASSTIPAIYIQQFWDTIRFDSKAGSYKCQLDEQWFNLNQDTLRDALQITPVNNNRAFSSPPTPDILVEFVNKLGYLKEVMHLSNVTTNDMFQPWRALATIINLCLTGKTSGFEGEEPQRQKEAGTTYSRKRRVATSYLIPSHLKFSAKGSKREVFGMTIPNELINNVIREEDYYDAYLEKVAKHQRYIAAKKSKPAPAKPKEKKRKPVSESSEAQPLAKRAKAGKVTKKRNVKSSKQLVDEFVDEGFTGTDTGSSTTYQRCQVKGKEKRRSQLPTETAGREDSTSLYAELGLYGSDTESDEEMPSVVRSGTQDEGQAGADPGTLDEGQAGSDPGTLDEGQAGSDPGTLDEGQAGSNPDDVAESLPLLILVFSLDQNLEPLVDVE
ncbi:E-beta-farnesene synthase [Tanacetum coccineum]